MRWRALELFVIKAPQTPKPAAQPVQATIHLFCLSRLGGLDLGNMPLGNPLGGMPVGAYLVRAYLCRLTGPCLTGPGAAPWAGGGGYAPPAGGKSSGGKASKKAKKLGLEEVRGKSKRRC